jgi:iron complex transport system ATP-binding protein
MECAVLYDDISFGYDKNTSVINNLSLSINKGDLIAILGANGCGKSTLFGLTSKNLLPSNGKIYINGVDIEKISVKDLAKQIAFVFQEIVTNIDYTVYEYISFGRNPYLSFTGKLTDEDCNIIYNSAKECGIEKLLNKSINKISGGEKQLAHFARALAQQTDIIMLDEPTSMLDFGNQKRFYDFVAYLHQISKTVIFTTHNPNHLIDLNCDVAVMQNGKILKTGIASEVIDLQTLSQIYNCNFVYANNHIGFKERK